jgi:6-pyruvoyltetrahydropterin/6-carboxytetrahydropterin synthase
MNFEISQTFGFEAAHTLLRSVPVDEFNASARVHGHSYLARVAVAAELSAGIGVDLFYLRESLTKVRQELDHQLLNDVPGLKYATLECLCEFIAAKVGRQFLVAWVEVSRPSTGDACRVTP